VVAIGSLDKIWFTPSEDVAEENLYSAFHNHFGLEWAEVLNAADNSFDYNIANNAYFAVRGLRSIQNLTLDQLMGRESVDRPPNVIIS